MLIGLKILLFPGFLLGPGSLLQKLLGLRPRISHAIAISLSIWSIIGWFSLNHLREITLFLSILGSLGLFLLDFKKEFKLLIILLTVTIFRFLIISYMTMPFGCDTIMHTYTVMSLYQANGYTSIFMPFGVKGVGIFNIGFHFIASEIQYILNISSLNATIFTGFIFFALLYIAINEIIQKPLLSALILFTLVRPANSLAWGGYPTLASIAFSLIAFKYAPPYSFLFWLGALSTHFIPATAAFIPYFIKYARNKNTYIYGFVTALFLLPQYYRTIFWNLQYSHRETVSIDRYILENATKSQIVAVILLILALLAYSHKKHLRRRVPLWTILIPLALGILSNITAYLHIPFTIIKGFYLGRLLVPLLIPSSWGLYIIFTRYKFSSIILPLLGLSLIIATHKRHSKDPSTWKMIKNFANHRYEDDYVALVRYGTEESYLPAFGKPAWYSHYIITLKSQFTEGIKKKSFLYVFLRPHDSIYRNIVNKFHAVEIDSSTKVKLFRFPTPQPGDSIIKIVQINSH